MDNLLQAMQSMPTALYSGGMIMVVVYWIFIVVGAIDINLLSFDVPNVDMDADLDLDTDLDAHLDTAPNFFNGILENIGFGTVPITIIFSMLTSSGWLTGLSLELLVWPHLSSFMPTFVFAIIQFCIMFMVSIKLSALCAIPLKKSLAMQTFHGQGHLIGKTVQVTSASVSAHMGTASYRDADCDLVLNVRLRADTESNTSTDTSTKSSPISKRDDVIICDYHQEKNIYYIQPIHTPAITKQEI